MFLAFLIGCAIFCLLPAFYLLTRFKKFALVKRLANGNKRKHLLIAAIPILVLVIFAIFSFMNTLTAIIHLCIFWAFFDLCFFLIDHFVRKEDKIAEKDVYIAGIIAICVTAVYLAIGAYNDFHVTETHYDIATDKDVGEGFRVVQITDSHIGATFDGEDFAKHLERIQATNPDLVVITGDYVDDDSKKEDMIVATEALGKLKTTYGVYYAFGNHDKAYFGYRDFTEDDLRSELKKNNIIIMEDDTALIDERLYLIGRQDKTEQDRKSANELTSDLDPSKFTLVLDHQPNDFDAEAKAGMDLVLSGHTHGGQFFPIGQISVLAGSNDRYYGMEQRDNTRFIVSSGISDWQLIFKMFTFSEYTVIDIHN